jgi:hypothetical protein
LALVTGAFATWTSIVIAPNSVSNTTTTGATGTCVAATPATTIVAITPVIDSPDFPITRLPMFSRFPITDVFPITRLPM